MALAPCIGVGVDGGAANSRQALGMRGLKDDTLLCVYTLSEIILAESTLFGGEFV